MAQKFALISMLALITITMVCPSIRAEWIDNGVAICTSIGSQINMQIIPDGTGGAYFVWEDTRNGNPDIYAQRINASGELLWGQNGIAVCTATGTQAKPQIALDSSGAITVVWEDRRSGGYEDIYAQRISPTGNALWATNGIVICSAQLPQTKPCIIVSNWWAGEAVIAWEDMRNDGTPAIYVQKVRSNGTVAYAANGISICNSRSYNPRIISDNDMGAIVVWEKFIYDYDIYAQRIDYYGTIQWASGGVPVIAWSGDDTNADVVADGSGGAVIACESRLTNYVQIFAQRINSNGARCWQYAPYTFVPICNSCSKFHQTRPKVAVDQWANAIIVYEDGRNLDTSPNIYAQKLLSQHGARAWLDGGKAICSTPDWQDSPAIVSARYGGAIISWQDRRDGNYDIYSQMIDPNGNALWINNGVPMCTATLEQTAPRIASDGSGGAIIAWLDHRSSGRDIYAGKVVPEMACAISWEFINSANSQPTLKDTLRGCPAGDYDLLKVHLDFNDYVMNRDISASEISLDMPDASSGICLWRQENINADYAAQAPNYLTTITQPYISGCNICPLGCAPLTLAVRLNTVKIGQVDYLKINSPDLVVIGDSRAKVDLSDVIVFGSSYNYSCGQPRFNSCCDFNLDCMCNITDLTIFGLHYQHRIPWGTGLEYIRNANGISDVYVRFVLDKEPDQYSPKEVQVSVYIGGADNVSAMSLDFDCKRLGLEFLDWKSNSSLGWESVILPEENEKRSSMIMLGMNMESIGKGEVKLGTLEFKLESFESLDFRKAEYAFGVGAVIDAQGAICMMRSIALEQEQENKTAYANSLARNYPNPFNPSTTIEYSIAKSGPVNLSVYNIKGELVRTLVDGFKLANKYAVVWDGNNNAGAKAASGVFFYRIRTKDYAESSRMVLLR